MITTNNFIQFLNQTFDTKQLFIDEFKPGLWFIEIDCFESQPYKMAIELSVDDIKISTVDKQPAIDFSLYDHIFKENKAAEEFIAEAVKRGNVSK